MPPKPKFTKDEIIAAALDIVSKKGAEALTARELAGKLHTSTRPIFTAFQSMEEVLTEVRNAARKKFDGYMQKAPLYTPAIKKIGMQVLLFSMEEPKLFEFLFMENPGAPHQLGEGFLSGDNAAKRSVEIIQKDYGLTYEQSRTLFHHIWIFTFGIGTLCATGMCKFSSEQLNELLGQDFMAMLNYIKSGKANNTTVFPTLASDADLALN